MTVWQKWASLAIILALAITISAAQRDGKKPRTRAEGTSAELLTQWNDVGRKLSAMAEDFPEDKYDYRPAPSVRTFAEQLLHMAGSNYLFTNAALGQRPPGPESESRERFKSKAEVLAYVKKSFQDGAEAIQSKSGQGLNQSVKNPEGGRQIQLLGLAYSLLEHAGEHYGQLVMYYRLAGLVPPESRPRN